MDVKRAIFLALLGLFVLQFLDETHAANKNARAVTKRTGSSVTKPIIKYVEIESSDNSENEEEDSDLQDEDKDRAEGSQDEEEDNEEDDEEDDEEESEEDSNGEDDSNESQTIEKLGGEDIPGDIYKLIEVVSTKIVEFLGKNPEAKKTMEENWEKIENIVKDKNGSKLIIKISGLVKNTLLDANGQKTISHLAQKVPNVFTHEGGIDFMLQTFISMVKMLVSKKTIPAVAKFSDNFSAKIINEENNRAVMTAIVKNLFTTLGTPVNMKRLKTGGVTLPHLQDLTSGSDEGGRRGKGGKRSR